MSTMKIYKCYQVYGYKEAFFLQPLKAHPYNWDEITVQLPEGAEPVQTEFGSPAVKLANGHLCSSLHGLAERLCRSVSDRYGFSQSEKSTSDFAGCRKRRG